MTAQPAVEFVNRGVNPEGAEMKRWWFSWHGPEDDFRSVIWPMPGAWLGYWCSGYGDGYSTIVGWAMGETPEDIAALVSAGWPEWNGWWRIEPREKPEAPGDRFPACDWAKDRV